MRKDLLALAEELARIKATIEPLTIREAELREKLEKGIPVTSPNEPVLGYLIGTYMKDSTSTDEVGLIAYLAIAGKLDLVTSPKLDSKKLASAITLGQITKEEIDPFVTTNQKKVLLVRKANGKENGNGKTK